MSKCTMSVPFRTFQKAYPELRDAVVTDPYDGCKRVFLPLVDVEEDNVEVEVPDFFDVAYGELLAVAAPYLTEDAGARFASEAIEALKVVFVQNLARSSCQRTTATMPSAEQDHGVPLAVAKATRSAFSEVYVPDTEEEIPDVEKQTHRLQSERDAWYDGPNPSLEKELEACWNQPPSPEEPNLYVGMHTTNVAGMAILRGLDKVAKTATVTIQSGHYGVKTHRMGDEDYDDYSLPLGTVVGQVKESLPKCPVTVGFAAAGSELGEGRA